ncbi:hypothetical protein KIH79_09310 [Bifidobacterium sp. 82T10]|uniref:Uncharacterized protein n=1 Tax=Bifidobacterium miconis TaxID=2834435 RepID=A0ABS6WIL8_9BIFI|nr:hypothetical protein [Bifidobacterium miconis]MBW3093112.1 hypothetical protein [Bifidobacterium miconis]
MSAKKIPQDHQPKKNEPRTVAVDGISVTIDPTVLDDYMVVHRLAKMQDGDPVAADNLLSQILGVDQFERVLGQLASRNHGRIPGSVFAAFLEQLFNSLNPNS